MKTKNLFAILLALTLLISTFIIPTSAKESIMDNTNVEIIINNDVSEETKSKIENYFAAGEPVNNDGRTTYGITCTLLGHKLEGTTVEVTTHKVRATSPRCVTKTYDYETCTRCDYETSTLMGTEYIVCCA